MAGKTIKVAGIAAGFVAMTACSDGKPQRSISADTLTDNTVEIKEPTPRDCRLVGDISLNHKGNSADEEEIHPTCHHLRLNGEQQNIWRNGGKGFIPWWF